MYHSGTLTVISPDLNSMRIGMSTSCLEQSIIGLSARNLARLTSASGSPFGAGAQADVHVLVVLVTHYVGTGREQRFSGFVFGFKQIVGCLPTGPILKIGYRARLRISQAQAASLRGFPGRELRPLPPTDRSESWRTLWFWSGLPLHHRCKAVRYKRS